MTSDGISRPGPLAKVRFPAASLSPLSTLSGPLGPVRCGFPASRRVGLHYAPTVVLRTFDFEGLRCDLRELGYKVER